MSDEAKALMERLLAKHISRSVVDGQPIGTAHEVYVNPDGPAAADLIETQAREIERLGKLIAEFVNQARALSKELDEKDAEIERLRRDVWLGRESPVYRPRSTRREP